MHLQKVYGKIGDKESRRDRIIYIYIYVHIQKKKGEKNRAKESGKEDGYTEVANEATAVDFPPQTLRRMREQSCNGLVINNALVSRPRTGEEWGAGRGEGGKKDGGRGRERERKYTETSCTG